MTARARLRFLKKIFRGEERIKVDSYETRMKRPVPTIETVLHVKEKFRAVRVHLLLGSDSLKSFPRWKDHPGISKEVSLVVFERPGFPIRKSVRRLNLPKIRVSSSGLKRDYLAGRELPFLAPRLTRNDLDAEIHRG